MTRISHLFGCICLILLAGECLSTRNCIRGDNTQGICKSFEDCMLEGGETERVGSIKLCADEVKSFDDIIVCCRPTPETTAKNKCNEWGRGCRGNHLLVSNGRDALPGEFPYMVSIQNYNEHICGGVLISPEFILTAAHCLRDFNRISIRLILGAFNIKLRTGNTQKTSVLKVIPHPEYRRISQSSYNDVALLKIEKVHLDLIVRPACLPFDAASTYNGALTVIGWGAKEYAGGFSDTLQKGFLKYIPKMECVLQTPADTFKYPIGISRDVICAHDIVTDACQGDSGGPLLSPGSTRCYNRVLGVVSVGKECPSNVPSQYTKVSEYLRWIVNEVFTHEMLFL